MFAPIFVASIIVLLGLGFAIFGKRRAPSLSPAAPQQSSIATELPQPVAEARRVFSDAQITHGMLQEICTHLKSIRAMLKFFVVLTIVGLIVEFLYVMSR